MLVSFLKSENDSKFSSFEIIKKNYLDDDFYSQLLQLRDLPSLKHLTYNLYMLYENNY